MKIQALPYEFTVCKVADYTEVDLTAAYCFIGKTDEENSLVCHTDKAPAHTLAREDGWRGFRIQGVLDFSLVGILAKIAGLLAQHQIPIFAVSTYNTDYILLRKENYRKALEVLRDAGYETEE